MMSPEEIAAVIAEALGKEDEVPASPWLNADTTAAGMMFAAHIAQSASLFFQNLSLLASGQSAHEYSKMDAQDFINESMSSIMKLPEEKGD